jgi:hypothetical protein
VIEAQGYAKRGGDADIWSWSSAGEYGRAIWDAAALRVDLVFGTDESVVDRAESSLTAAD